MFHDREVGVGDFVLLPKIEMESFLENLKLRHSADLNYTYIGEVCVSVNPYKSLDIYGPSYVTQYKGRESTRDRLIFSPSRSCVQNNEEIFH